MSTAAQELPQTHSEVVAMALLLELQPAIAVALDSLGDKWFGGVARRHGVAYTRVCDRDEWQAFKDRCIAQFGADKLEDVPLSSYDAAAEIGVEAYYDSHYRGYCQYTHGALEAVSGGLDELTDPEDTRVMLHCSMIGLEALC